MGSLVEQSTHQLDYDIVQRLVLAVRDLATARDLGSVVEVVRHAAREMVRADGATFVLRDEGMCFYVDEDAIEPLWRGQRFPLGACISGWSMMHSEQVVIEDIYLDDRIPHEAYRPTFVHSLVMTPVRALEPIAAIGTYWAGRHRPSKAELEALQTLADSTATAIESIAVMNGLESRIAERTAELEANNRDLAAFAYVAAHDLKEPLTTIQGHAELVQDLETDHLSDRASTSLAAVQRQAGRMATLIDVLLAYSQAATTDIEPERVDFNALVADVRTDLTALIDRRGASVEVEALPVGRGSRVLLERVLQNLIANAVNYGHPERPRVVIDALASADAVTLRVSDNGGGVPQDERESIFDMFKRGSSAGEVAGSGIGLAFARRVVARHDGTLTVTDGPIGGACFELTLPLRPVS